jgi:Rod binding domain-containing protein
MPPSAAAVTGSYLDFGALGKLKGQARTDAKAATRETAQQFEAMFLQMMMKTMRDSVPKSGMNESQAEETFQGMFDKEVSLSMAKRNALGLADMLVKHMPDPSATPPSTAQMLKAREPKAMPLQAPPASPMALQAAAPTLAPLPKAPGAIPLTGVSAASPSGLTVTHSPSTDGAKP